MKRNKIGIIIVIIGIGVILYPIISNMITIYNQSTAILSYKEKLDEMTEEEIEAEKEKIRQYNSNLTTDVVVSSDDDEEEREEGVSYVNVLDIGDVIGYISIPTIDVYLPLYHGTSDDVLQAGIGHVENSSFPIGETSTHAVFAGHTGLVRTKMFDDLDELVVGDKFYIYILDEKFAYQIDQINVVEPDEVSNYTQIEEGEEYVTLMTCTPYGINTHRLLVRGTRIEETEETESTLETDAESIQTRIDRYKLILILSIILLLILLLIFIIIIIIKRLRKKYNKGDNAEIVGKKDKKNNNKEDNENVVGKKNKKSKKGRRVKEKSKRIRKKYNGEE